MVHQSLLQWKILKTIHGRLVKTILTTYNDCWMWLESPVTRGDVWFWEDGMLHVHELSSAPEGWGSMGHPCCGMLC